MRQIFLPLVASIAVMVVQGDNEIPEYKRTPLGDSIDIASMKILKELYQQSSDNNVVSSPLGVLTLLSLYASGSEGESREEIMRLLGFTDYRQLSDSYSELSERFASMDPSYLTLANKVFVSDKFSLEEGFSNTARAYKSEVDSINFDDPKSAADIINEWSSRKTKGMINHPISESNIDMDTAVALLNVIFFQGHWHVPFNASETKPKQFNIDRSTTVELPMMHLKQSLYYHRDDDMGVEMIQLPYKESKFRMIVVLPNDVDGLPQVLEKAAQKGLLENIFKMYPAGTEVHLDIPKFETRTRINLKNVLPKVGVSSIFGNGSSGIVKERSVKVSQALQEAVVKVDEEGATAGAFTGYVMVLISEPPQSLPPIPFKVDRPFLYAILHDDIVLFAGTYAH